MVAGHLRGDDSIVQAVKMTLPDGYPGGDLAIPAATMTPQAAPPFVALALPGAQAEPAADIRIEVRRGALAVSVIWPGTGAASCAAWLRELLR